MEACLQADAHLRLLASESSGADPTERSIETTAFDEATPQRHVSTNEVVHQGSLSGHAAATASNDPVELGREPARTPRLPDGHHLAADTEHMGVGIGRHQRSKAVPSRDRLIVKEGDDFSRGRGYPALRARASPFLLSFAIRFTPGSSKVDRR